MAGRPKRRARLGLATLSSVANIGTSMMAADEMEAERESGPYQTLEAWRMLPEEMRDDFAARALYECMGRHATAAIRLGFKLPTEENRTYGDRAARMALLAELFGTPGVKKRLEDTFSDADANRKAIVARITQIALNGADELALRAAKTLADYTGDRADKNNAINFHLWGLVAAKNAQVAAPPNGAPKPVAQHEQSALPPAEDVSVILSHEPGAPTRVVDEQVQAVHGGSE